MDVGTLVVVGLGLCAAPLAFLEYALSHAKREATRKMETR
jgi:hypothetical protein